MCLLWSNKIQNREGYYKTKEDISIFANLECEESGDFSQWEWQARN